MAEEDFLLPGMLVFDLRQFLCVLQCLLCEGPARFGACFSQMDLDNNGYLTWRQLETVLVIATHGDPSFASEILAYFKVPMLFHAISTPFNAISMLFQG